MCFLGATSEDVALLDYCGFEMKKSEHYFTTIECVEFPNKGIGYVEDTPCVIKNTLPGQKIEFSVSKKRSNHVEGNLIGVIEPAPNEIDSPCPHFGTCGGCTYMNLGYEDQLKLKEEQIHKLLERGLKDQKTEWTFEGIKASPLNCEYRNKMEFSFGDSYKDGPLCLGMHKRGSFYDVVTVSECRLVDEDFRNILKTTLQVFEGYSYFHKLSHEGFLRHLLVRKTSDSGQILVALVTSSQGDSNKTEELIGEWVKCLLGLKLKNESVISGILHIINDSVADVVIAQKTELLYGKDYINEKILGLDFKITPFSFFQTNSKGAEVLYSTVRDYVGDLRKGGVPDAVVYDLYSGTGTIAQLMAPVSKKVYGIEIVEEAVAAAKENAAGNGLNNCEFIAGDVLKELDQIPERPDFIILDPPRDGVNPKALRRIIDYGMDNLVYISCKPTSLIRDMEMFLGNGYYLQKACAVDMFPNTGNIEVVAMITKVK